MGMKPRKPEPPNTANEPDFPLARPTSGAGRSPDTFAPDVARARSGAAGTGGKRADGPEARIFVITMREWRRRHFFHTNPSIKMTWKLRVALLVVTMIPAGILACGPLASHIGRSLVCKGDVAESDVIHLENFDQNYLLFERAARASRNRSEDACARRGFA
jgi:hypothetical protein